MLILPRADNQQIKGITQNDMDVLELFTRKLVKELAEDNDGKK